MAICSSCGATFEGKFCPQCGAAGAGGTPTPSEPAGGGQSTSPAQPAASGMTNNVAGTLCYVLGILTGIIFLVIEPYNKIKEVRFHAFQSIFLWVAWFVVFVAVSIISPILMGIMPGALAALGWIVIGLVDLVIGLGAFVIWIYLLIKTYQGQKVVLPIIGPLAEKQA